MAFVNEWTKKEAKTSRTYINIHTHSLTHSSKQENKKKFNYNSIQSLLVFKCQKNKHDLLK